MLSKSQDAKIMDSCSTVRGADGASLHEQLVFSSVPRLGQPNMFMIADLVVVHHYAYLSTHAVAMVSEEPRQSGM